MVQQSLDLPVLSLAIPNICKLNDISTDNISSMWSVFSKCKDNLEHGHRLENLSWRLWFRESMMVHRLKDDNHNHTDGIYEHVLRTPIPTMYLDDQQQQSHDSNNDDSDDEIDDYYYQPSTSVGSSMKDSAVSGCGRSIKRLSVSSFKRIVSSLGSDHPVEEARKAYVEQVSCLSVTKPTTAETARLSDNTDTMSILKNDAAHLVCRQGEENQISATSHDSSPTSLHKSTHYLMERDTEQVVAHSNNNNDDDKNNVDLCDDNGDEEDNDNDNDDTFSEWSAQDDDTVFADDDAMDGESSMEQVNNNYRHVHLMPTHSNHDQHYHRHTNGEFRKQMPKKNDDLPKQSLLSILFKKHQEQQDPEHSNNKLQQRTTTHKPFSHRHHHQRMQSTASTTTMTKPSPYQQQYTTTINRKSNTTPIYMNRAGRIHHPPVMDDLSESLQFCVDWERRQNVSPPVTLLQKQQRRLPAHVATSRATATCTTTTTTTSTHSTSVIHSWLETFRGW
ncbi:hypothetical protein BDA99DRAFT_540244 [Phascolomyces articulosus]|uniref:Nitrogen regulatory protein areA GATA-like domain-containing protein n=1 Tax=Phascolomyces articulosus TaxID=60185 RepID=A0AAD5K4T3_9FUNG|nr:hypothetical protein BDA99DRAFT_540244 [Phascolomyces articulosus]